MVFRCNAVHVVEYRLDHGGIEFLGPKTVAPVDDGGHLSLFHESRADILVERVAERTGLFCTVENGNSGCGGGDDGKQMFGGEGAIQANLDQTHGFTSGVEVIHNLFDGFTGRAHGDDNPICIGIADIVEQVVFASGEFVHFFHIVGDDVRHFAVKGVDSFAALKIDVRVLGRSAQFRRFRVHCPGAEIFQRFHVDQFAHVLIIDEFDFLDLMGGAEPVEKMKKGYTGFDGGQMGNQSKVHGFLYGG
jgi:hypothetical protein